MKILFCVLLIVIPEPVVMVFARMMNNLESVLWTALILHYVVMRSATSMKILSYVHWIVLWILVAITAFAKMTKPQASVLSIASPTLTAEMECVIYMKTSWIVLLTVPIPRVETESVNLMNNLELVLLIASSTETVEMVSVIFMRIRSIVLWTVTPTLAETAFVKTLNNPESVLSIATPTLIAETEFAI